MSTLTLPASCYEEAMPDLRAPYLPSQIRPLIVQAPKNDRAPCRIALYTIGETLMDRFNLCCGSNWEAAFATEIHKELEKKDDNQNPYTVHYFKITCSLTVFGQEHSDFGEGEATSQALAEFDARAQALKRASRWHGPGQCLYVFGGEEFIMWRGAEPGKLQIPRSGTEPHRKPFFDAPARQAVRDEYAKWLRTDGEGQFGVPLDHLKVAEAIRERALHRPLMAVPDLPSAPTLSPPAGRQPEREQRISVPESSATIGPQSPSRDQQQIETNPGARVEQEPAVELPEATEPARQGVQGLPMPDAPASQEVVDIAESAGFDATVAHALSNLARADGQEDKLSERQQKGVVNWLIILSEVNLTSEEIGRAVQYVAGKGTSQEQRQATFSRWLAKKASGQSEGPSTESATTPETPAPSDEDDAPRTEDAEALDTARALNRIHKMMDQHGYTDRSVALLAKLAIGQPPKRKLEWAAVPTATMAVLAELLESAAAIGWTAERLGKEVLAAHGRKGQVTSAGRFSAFAGHLTELAETVRASEAA
jgi:hypothetical protein